MYTRTSSIVSVAHTELVLTLGVLSQIRWVKERFTCCCAYAKLASRKVAEVVALFRGELKPEITTSEMVVETRHSGHGVDQERTRQTGFAREGGPARTLMGAAEV